MSAAKPVSKTLVFIDRQATHEKEYVAVVTVNAARIVQVSNYADLKDKDGQTICTVTWPSRYIVKEI